MNIASDAHWYTFSYESYFFPFTQICEPEGTYRGSVIWILYIGLYLLSLGTNALYVVESLIICYLY
jgi:hypothetical protein